MTTIKPSQSTASYDSIKLGIDAHAQYARAGVKADGSCRCESGGPPEYGAGVFSRRRTPMDARLASLLRPGAAITLSLNNNGFRMVQ